MSPEAAAAKDFIGVRPGPLYAPLIEWAKRRGIHKPGTAAKLAIHLTILGENDEQNKLVTLLLRLDDTRRERTDILTLAGQLADRIRSNRSAIRTAKSTMPLATSAEQRAQRWRDVARMEQALQRDEDDYANALQKLHELLDTLNTEAETAYVPQEAEA